MLKEAINFEDEIGLEIAVIGPAAHQAFFVGSSTFMENVEIMRAQTCVSPLELALKERVNTLEGEVAQLKAAIALLEKRLDLDSTTSSKPPSTDSDWKKRPPISSKTDKEPKAKGGQQGHTGDTLTFVDNPDEVENHTPNTCPECGKDLSDIEAKKVIKRQVHDVVIKKRIVEHVVEEKVCSCGCCVSGKFPPNITAPVQYGPTIKANAVYLSSNYIGKDRLSDVLSNMFGIGMSDTTILEYENKLAKNAEEERQKTEMETPLKAEEARHKQEMEEMKLKTSKEAEDQKRLNEQREADLQVHLEQERVKTQEAQRKASEDEESRKQEAEEKDQKAANSKSKHDEELMAHRQALKDAEGQRQAEADASAREMARLKKELREKGNEEAQHKQKTEERELKMAEEAEDQKRLNEQREADLQRQLEQEKARTQEGEEKIQKSDFEKRQAEERANALQTQYNVLEAKHKGHTEVDSVVEYSRLESLVEDWHTTNEDFRGLVQDAEKDHNELFQSRLRSLESAKAPSTPGISMLSSVSPEPRWPVRSSSEVSSSSPVLPISHESSSASLISNTLPRSLSTATSHRFSPSPELSSFGGLTTCPCTIDEALQTDNAPTRDRLTQTEVPHKSGAVIMLTSIRDGLHSRFLALHEELSDYKSEKAKTEGEIAGLRSEFVAAQDDIKRYGDNIRILSAEKESKAKSLGEIIKRGEELEAQTLTGALAQEHKKLKDDRATISAEIKGLEGQLQFCTDQRTKHIENAQRYKYDETSLLANLEGQKAKINDLQEHLRWLILQLDNIDKCIAFNNEQPVHFPGHSVIPTGSDPSGLSAFSPLISSSSSFSLFFPKGITKHTPAIEDKKFPLYSPENMDAILDSMKSRMEKHAAVHIVPANREPIFTEKKLAEYIQANSATHISHGATVILPVMVGANLQETHWVVVAVMPAIIKVADSDGSSVVKKFVDLERIEIGGEYVKIVQTNVPQQTACACGINAAANAEGLVTGHRPSTEDGALFVQEISVLAGPSSEALSQIQILNGERLPVLYAPTLPVGKIAVINPYLPAKSLSWIPAFAGMTSGRGAFFDRANAENVLVVEGIAPRFVIPAKAGIQLTIREAAPSRLQQSTLCIDSIEEGSSQPVTPAQSGIQLKILRNFAENYLASYAQMCIHFLKKTFVAEKEPGALVPFYGATAESHTGLTIAHFIPKLPQWIEGSKVTEEAAAKGWLYTPIDRLAKDELKAIRKALDIFVHPDKNREHPERWDYCKILHDLTDPKSTASTVPVDNPINSGVISTLEGTVLPALQKISTGLQAGNFALNAHKAFIEEPTQGNIKKFEASALHLLSSLAYGVSKSGGFIFSGAANVITAYDAYATHGFCWAANKEVAISLGHTLAAPGLSKVVTAGVGWIAGAVLGSAVVVPAATIAATVLTGSMIAYAVHWNLAARVASNSARHGGGPARTGQHGQVLKSLTVLCIWEAISRCRVLNG